MPSHTEAKLKKFLLDHTKLIQTTSTNSQPANTVAMPPKKKETTTVKTYVHDRRLAG